MPKRDRRVDTYIANSAEFARPVLRHLRKLVHAGCPEVEETLKWNFPAFMHKGILCSMAAFKQHCTFGFWKWKLILGDKKHPGNGEQDGMGQFGRITSVSDLPKDNVLLGYINKAACLNEQGIKLPARPKRRQKKELVIPDYFISVLKENERALTTFQEFSYSHKKEYVEWITEAKREETRNQRIKTAIQWLSEGKSRHWKYAKC